MLENADAIVKCRLFSTTEGGRAGPTPESEFNVVMVLDGEKYDCRLYLDGIGSIGPGAEVTVPVRFIDPQRVKPLLAAGTRFGLWEGGAIGEGVVLEVSSPPD